MKRRLRKYPQHHPSESDPKSSGHRRMPYGLMWLVLTIIVLALVIGYDRRSIHEAEQHLATGKELEKKGLFMEALNEYDQAFENKRLGRKAKAQAALSMAEIYYNHLEDYPSAHKYYVQARQSSAAIFDSEELQNHAELAATRAKGAGVLRKNRAISSRETTPTIVQRVELISEPIVDRRGPVLATFTGGEVNAGELLRILQTRPEFNSPAFRQDPDQLKAFLQKVLREDLAYEAALSAGLHKDPDVSTRLYDYQKQLITQRYLVDRRDQAMKVENADVEKYYEEHAADYTKPARIRLSLIKTDSESSATEFLKMLRDQTPFGDVATSYSQDKASAPLGGDIGFIDDQATSIPGVGEAPRIVKGLFSLKTQSVSEVVPFDGAYYIFKVAEVHPAIKVTLSEARPRIENILRGQSVDTARHKLQEQLNEAFEPVIDEEELKQFWDFVQENTRESATETGDSVSTDSLVQESDSTTSTTAGDSVGQ